MDMYPLFDLAREYADASGRLGRFTALAEHATRADERTALTTTAEHWRQVATDRQNSLFKAMQIMRYTPVEATPDATLSVASHLDGVVEVRGTSDGGTCAVRVRYTPAQALAAGAALIACATLTTTPPGSILPTILAAFPPTTDTTPGAGAHASDRARRS